MEPAYPNISDELRQSLAQKGLRAYKPKPLPEFLNPHSHTYWQTNVFLLAACWFGRRSATKDGCLRIFWSTAMCSIPFFALMSKGKLDSLDEILGKRRSFEERLEYSPITRRAWDRAVEINNEYQENLKQEISELEAKLYKKQQSQQ
ncbi:hypothetical protein PPERSA_00079 [Pseudocohnilembus persalinus]|uniref:Uncharacterized protein n=1 Tax=Pseudocohnilembus persalinus TaxID=266149 RepID=A0A0V0QYD7_PSEPJ|nr:hypothetical protein PPERSA_00079 [Pseudocohnilembus persalinus]|eukprot:KRX07169.1 hypothetical protein PPERSA_00079 [Pseudocohnilembus persalinus]